jgi:tetratricopeptide (TPR) repeat protein
MRRCAYLSLVVFGLTFLGDARSAAAQQATEEEAAPDAPGEQPASTTDREAREAYEAGAVAFDEGRYSIALDFFRRSFTLSGRPALLYNVGLSADRLRRDREALEAFEGYIDAVPDSPHARQVNARIASLRAAIAADEEDSAREEREREERERVLLAEARGDNESIFEAWWFWTIVGVVVAGAATAAILVATTSDRPDDPLPGTQGAVFMTLSVGP